MRSDQQVTDWDGKKLAIGTRAIYGSPETGKEADATITVVGVSDYDVDYSDATERPECSPPRIKVRFGDGTEDDVTTHDATPITWDDYPDGPAVMVFVADDLEVLPECGVDPGRTPQECAPPVDHHGCGICE